MKAAVPAERLTPAALTPEGYERARRLLMRRDPILGAAIKRIGACEMASRQRHDHLSALCGSIVSQQLSAGCSSFFRTGIFLTRPRSRP